MKEVTWVIKQGDLPFNEEIQSKRRFTSKGICSCLACFASLCSLACAIYVWITFTKIDEMRKDLTTLVNQPKDFNRTLYQHASLMMKLQFDHVTAIGTQKSIDHLPPSSSRTSTSPLVSYDENTNISKTNDDMQDTEAGVIEEADVSLDVPFQQPAAIHFVPNGVTLHSIQHEFINNQMCISKWSGVVCRNNTYRSTGSNQIIEFWKRAPWTQSHSANVLQVGTTGSGGVYSLQTGGLYLLYLNILISATHSKHDVGIFISDTKKLICRENLDFIRGSTSTANYAKAKTCSVIGVFYIEQNQTISVKIITRSTEIYMDSYNTNFGAVLIA